MYQSPHHNYYDNGSEWYIWNCFHTIFFFSPANEWQKRSANQNPSFEELDHLQR